MYVYMYMPCILMDWACNVLLSPPKYTCFLMAQGH